MSFFSHSLVGWVEVASSPPVNDPPTLQSWFDDAAGNSDRDEQCLRTLDRAPRRSNRVELGVVRADINQLLADLEAEFERLVER